MTRPARESLRWVMALRERGLDAQALPLIEIAAAQDLQAMCAAWQRIRQYRAVMFVSGNAAEHFMSSRPDSDVRFSLGEGAQFQAWTTGPGTRDALLSAGLPAAMIDSPAADALQFDSEALWSLVSRQVRAGDRVLIVRGSDARGQSAGRDWLAQQITQAGAMPETVVAYERRTPMWGELQRTLATEAATDGSVWLFSSSEAIVNLRTLLPLQSWNTARTVTTHPRIAQAAHEAGFGVVCGSRPALPEVVASIESLA